MIYYCDQCKTNEVTRTKPRGRIPSCEECKLKSRIGKNQRLKKRRQLGIAHDSHKREDGSRYGEIWYDFQCTYCGSTFHQKQINTILPVCKSLECKMHHANFIANKNRLMRKPRYKKDKDYREYLSKYQRLIRRGLNIEWYNAQLKQCGICGNEKPGGKDNQWAIDHDHKCCKKGCRNCVRGLLCNACNMGLGMFKDNID